jgi:hypothetical protein
LFWVVLAVSLAIFANRNWNDVTVNLWGNIQADVKLPLIADHLSCSASSRPTHHARTCLDAEAQAGVAERPDSRRAVDVRAAEDR